MKKLRWSKNREFFILCVWLITALPVFASGHLPDIGGLLIILSFVLTTFITTVLLLSYLLVRKDGLRIPVWVFSFTTVGLQLYYGISEDVNPYFRPPTMLMAMNSSHAEGELNYYALLSLAIVICSLLIVNLLKPIKSELVQADNL